MILNCAKKIRYIYLQTENIRMRTITEIFKFIQTFRRAFEKVFPYSFQETAKKKQDFAIFSLFITEKIKWNGFSKSPRFYLESKLIIVHLTDFLILW